MPFLLPNQQHKKTEGKGLCQLLSAHKIACCITQLSFAPLKLRPFGDIQICLLSVIIYHVTSLWGFCYQTHISLSTLSKTARQGQCLRCCHHARVHPVQYEYMYYVSHSKHFLRICITVHRVAFVIVGWLVGVAFNAPLDTIQVIQTCM